MFEQPKRETLFCHPYNISVVYPHHSHRKFHITFYHQHKPDIGYDNMFEKYATGQNMMTLLFMGFCNGYLQQQKKLYEKEKLRDNLSESISIGWRRYTDMGAL